jgi:hypothetical protein
MLAVRREVHLNGSVDLGTTETKGEFSEKSKGYRKGS